MIKYYRFNATIRCVESTVFSSIMAPTNRRLVSATATGTIPKSNVAVCTEQSTIMKNENLDHTQDALSPDGRNDSNINTGRRGYQERLQPLTTSSARRSHHPSSQDNLNNRKTGENIANHNDQLSSQRYGM